MLETTFGGEEPPTEEVPTVTPEAPAVSAYGKEAMVPMMSKEEVRKALSETEAKWKKSGFEKLASEIDRLSKREAGIIMPFAGPKKNIPKGWLLCDAVCSEFV